MLRKFQKNIFALLSVMAIAVTTAISAFATDPIGVIPAGMDTGMAQIKADSLAGISAVVPYALAIVGVFLVWKYGMAFFKKVAK